MAMFVGNRRTTQSRLVRILPCVLGVLIVMSVTAAASTYIVRDFSVGDLLVNSNIAVTGTPSRGLFITYCAYPHADGIGGELYDMEFMARGGETFVFNKFKLDGVESSVRIEGHGPEPFSITAPGGFSGDLSPVGGAKLVTSIELSGWLTPILFHEISVELDVPAPAVYGYRGSLIENGSSSRFLDGTDFGIASAGTPVTRQFEIRNLGGGRLTLDANVIVSGVGFSITQQPSSSIAIGESSTFTVQFNPSAAGTVTGTVTISNNSEADDYTFEVEGEGTGDFAVPQLLKFEREIPGNRDTNADTLVFRATFDEDVQYVTAGDFTVTGADAFVTGVNSISPDSYELTVSGGNLANYDGTVGIDLADGQDIADLADNALPGDEPTTDQTYTLDNTAPTDPVLINASPSVGMWSNDNTVAILVCDPADAGSGVDGLEAEWNQLATWTPTETNQHVAGWEGDVYTATSDGDWYFHIATVDSVGNWSSGTTFGPFRIDTTSPINPTLDCTSHTASVWSNDDYVTLYDYSTSSDADSGVDGYEEAWTTSPAWMPGQVKTVEETVLNTGVHLPDGAWYYHIATVDNAGNWAAYDTYGPYQIDTQPPSVPTLASPGNEAYVNTATPRFEWESPTSDASGYSPTDCYNFQIMGSGTDIEYLLGSTATMQILPDGTFTWHVSLRDNAGNESGWSLLRTLHVDATPPMVTSVAVSDVWLDELDDGTEFTVTVNFSEDMRTDGSANPAIVFDPALDTILTVSAAAWADGDTWEVVYDVVDSDSVELGVDIAVSGGRDLVGNAQNPSINPDRFPDQFDVDMVTPPAETGPKLEITPTGSAGEGSFLDRSLDLEEGEEPPMVGLRPLTAIYEGGEAVGGACEILNSGGLHVRGSYIHVYIYWVNLEADPETVSLLDHWIVRYDLEARAYCYSWDTTETAPGTYDIHLSFADGSSHTCRIRLVAPAKQ